MGACINDNRYRVSAEVRFVSVIVEKGSGSDSEVLSIVITISALTSLLIEMIIIIIIIIMFSYYLLEKTNKNSTRSK